MSSLTVDSLLAMKPWPVFLEPFTLVYPPAPAPSRNTQSKPHLPSMPKRSSTSSFTSCSTASADDSSSWRNDRILDTLKRAETSFTSLKDVDKTDVEELVVTFTATLNRMSRSNYTKLSNELGRNPRLFTQDGLEAAVKCIYEKALSDDVTFHDLYARLCSDLSRPIKERGLNLPKSILNRCQETFQNSDASMTRLLSNISFIGHLFCVSLAPKTVIGICIDHLLGFTKSDEERGVEMICRLMKTVGPVLKESDVYPKIEALKPSLKPRFRFMVMDLMDLKQKEGWWRKLSILSDDSF